MSNLEFDRVRKTFGSTVALEGLRLEIGHGELVSLLGPSGCGKTTALRIAAGFDKADGGVVRVGGADITEVPVHRRNVGMVFQSYSLFPNLTVAENVGYGLRTRRISRADRIGRVDEMLDLVQLPDTARRYPHQLSGGQQQRVALARALAIRPSLLLLDEPLSALDAKVRTVLREEIRRIQTDLGITTLLVTHDQEEALAVSDRVGVMSRGRLEQLGTPISVYRHPTNPFVARFVGAMNELPGTVRALGGVEVGGVGVAVDQAARFSTGSPVTVLVRPEDVRFRPDPGQGLRAQVVSRTFQGAATMVLARLADSGVTVRSFVSGIDASTLRPGTVVSVEVDGDRALCEARS